MAQEAEQPIETTPTASVTDLAPETAAPEAVTPEPVAAEPIAPEPIAEAAAEAAAPEAIEPEVAAPAPAPAPALKAAPKKRGPKPAPKITATPVPAAPAAEKVVAKPVRGRPKAAAAKLPAPARVARKVSAKPVTSAVVKPVAKPGLKTAKPVRASSIEMPTTVSAAKMPLPTFKDTIMAKTAPTDFIASFSTAFGDFQTKAKTAYEKSTAALAEANDFAKGNVEAVVESGKILASGLQELSTSLVTESRSAFESLTAEVKDIAAVKSPNEFFSLQSALARKNFETAVAQMTKSSEAMMKLATDAISPLSSRVSIAVEKVSKAA